jgi:hypothetical protein
MRRMLLGWLILLGSMTAAAQSIDDLNIQIHGYATQGFLYTTQNNIFTATSSNGSPAWTEAVVNLTSLPIPKLRIAVQARYFLLGSFGNSILLDWAAADYKFNERIGVRFGKVKTPWGLFNEIQDIDPAYMWTLLPQGIYELDNRESYMTHYGGVVYGTIGAGKAGKLEYRAWAGEGLYSASSGLFINEAEEGYNLPQNIHGPLYGGALHWKTPVRGLMIGASDLTDNTWSAPITYQNGSTLATGTHVTVANSQPNYFAIYEKGRWMAAFEYERAWVHVTSVFPTLPSGFFLTRQDDRSEYGMISYKITPKLSAGVYDSQNSNRQAPLGPGRYSKDWAISGRYDFNSFLYAKAEQHFIDGTNLGYDMTLNPNLKPDTRLTALKIGVTF